MFVEPNYFTEASLNQKFVQPNTITNKDNRLPRKQHKMFRLSLLKYKNVSK